MIVFAEKWGWVGTLKGRHHHLQNYSFIKTPLIIICHPFIFPTTVKCYNYHSLQRRQTVFASHLKSNILWSYLELLVCLLRHIFLILSLSTGIWFEGSCLWVVVRGQSLLLDEESGVQIIMGLLGRGMKSLLQIEASNVLLIVTIVWVPGVAIVNEAGVHGVRRGVGRVQQSHADQQYHWLHSRIRSVSERGRKNWVLFCHFGQEKLYSPAVKGSKSPVCRSSILN